MKRLLVVCVAALLPCFLVSAQEADNSGRGVGLSVIPRLDLSPVFSTEKGGGTEFTLGNSSLYSLFEGNLTENLSFSVCNHWAGFDVLDDPFGTTKELYSNTFRSDYTNWVDWAYLTWQIGNFSITAGKDMVTTGGLEFDDYDFEVHPAFVSGFWNNFACYQWGAKVAYTTPSENDAIGFQFSTSPYGERPFSSKLFNYSLEWRGTHGPVETIWSVTAVQQDKGEFQPVIALGQRLNLDSWTVGLDAFNVVGDPLLILSKGITLLPGVTYSAGESLDLLAKGGWENFSILGNSVSHWWAGLACHWYPLRDSRDLRVHALAAYDQSSFVTLSLGVLYSISIL